MTKAVRNDPSFAPHLQFLPAASEVARVLRGLDWSDGPLAEAGAWGPLEPYLSLILHAEQPMTIVWGPQRLLLYNDAFARMATSQHPAALGRPLGENWPQLLASLSPRIEQAFTGVASPVTDIDIALRTPGGLKVNRVSNSATPITGPSGEVIGVFSAWRAMAQARALEPWAAEEATRRRELLLRLLQGQRDTDDPSVMMAAAVEATARYLGANRVGFFEMKDDETLEFGPSWTDGALEPLTGSFPVAELGRAYLADSRAGRTLGITDVRTDPLTQGAGFEARGVHSIIGAPIIRGGRWRAGLYVNHSVAREWSAEEIALVRDVADHTWDAVERARAWATLRASETRLQLALTAGSMATWELDVGSGTFIASDRLRALFGIEGDTPPAGGLISVVHPEDAARVFAEVDGSARGQGGLNTEFRILVGGAVRWIRTSALILNSPTGTRLVGLCEDITAQKQAMDELVRGREELQTMIDLLPVGIAVSHDSSATRITASPVLRKLLRLSPEQNASVTGPGYGGLPYRCMRGGHEVPGDQLPMQVASRTGVPLRDYEFDAVFADGTVTNLMVSAAPLFDAQGTVRGAVGSHVDVTALKNAHRKLELADRQKDEFLATLAHELRNPIAPIRYSAALLQPGITPARLEQTREIIDRQTTHMARLLDDLLDMSRVTRNVIELKRVVRDLRDIVQEAIEASRPAIDAAQQQLAIALPLEPVWVLGDPLRLLQITGNLLSNATKYTPQGGRIELDLETRDGSALLRVRDNGVGLSAEMLPKLFELFAQLHPQMKASKGGLGIGLAVVKRLVELHGGSIAVESAGAGRGAEFCVRLPLAKAPARHDPVPDVPGAFDPGHRVLVADDNADVADALAILIRSHGVPVEVAHGGREAIELAVRMRPSIAVLDIGMPEADGFAVARAIREQPWGANVHLIAVTGWGQADVQRRTADAGFNLHLVKPVDPDELLRRISEATRQERGPAVA